MRSGTAPLQLQIISTFLTVFSFDPEEKQASSAEQSSEGKGVITPRFDLSVFSPDTASRNQCWNGKEVERKALPSGAEEGSKLKDLWDLLLGSMDARLEKSFPSVKLE